MKRKQEEILGNPTKRRKPNRGVSYSNDERETERRTQNIFPTNIENEEGMCPRSIFEDPLPEGVMRVEVSHDTTLENPYLAFPGMTVVEDNPYTQDQMPNQPVGQFPPDFLQTSDRTFVGNHEFFQDQNQRQPDFIIQVVSGLEEKTQGFKLN